MTMHLKKPQPGAEYIMRVEVARDEQLLDAKITPSNSCLQNRRNSTHCGGFIESN